ncbi:hypothetical protein [Mucisphaera calidilacus]|uniref:Uncharacterized protein n=1 Tax=Mucisphaera calidilacus TaxID=2527982 RepID=A0A518BUZ7_9BACT|nr:hypothetical protein [Mucisphaera calidilacus]QDU70813.1 hypothetical protein Pan265_06500 [Mucisphaera calidilacus]
MSKQGLVAGGAIILILMMGLMWLPVGGKQKRATPEVAESAEGEVEAVVPDRPMTQITGVNRPGHYVLPEEDQGVLTLVDLVYAASGVDGRGPWKLTLTHGDGSVETFQAEGSVMNFPDLPLRKGDRISIEAIGRITPYEEGEVFLRRGQVLQSYAIGDRPGLTLRAFLEEVDASADAEGRIAVELKRDEREGLERYLFTPESMPERILRPNEVVRVVTEE